MLSQHILKEMHLHTPGCSLCVSSQLLPLSSRCIPKVSCCSSYTFPNPAPGLPHSLKCLCCLSDSNERGQLAAAFSMNILEWERSSGGNLSRAGSCCSYFPENPCAACSASVLVLSCNTSVADREGRHVPGSGDNNPWEFYF